MIFDSGTTNVATAGTEVQISNTTNKVRWIKVKALAGNSNKVYLLDFINAIEKELKAKAIRNYMPLQKGDVKITLSNTNLLKKITGYNPKTKYTIGVKKFIKWYFDYYN